jgi:hypothetical protein
MSDIKELRRAARAAHHRRIGWPAYYRENSAALCAVDRSVIAELLAIVTSGHPPIPELCDGYSRPLDFEMPVDLFSHQEALT